ncbi:MAG TPA: hypothetical protein VE967_10915 [Gemmatimonadaceae bacterium]|nr:hypothetical protein [Gemmatimonadaceae bacterium]
MQHGLMYSGAYETNYPTLKPGATGFTGSDGAVHEHRPWPPEVDGIRIWYMEQPGKHFYAVRVKDDKADLVLKHPILLEPGKHMGHGKRFSPEPTVVDTEMAVVILGDILAKNPDVRNELAGIRQRIRK